MDTMMLFTEMRGCGGMTTFWEVETDGGEEFQSKDSQPEQNDLESEEKGQRTA